MNGYDRRQLARAERLLERALQEVRLARERMDDEAEVWPRCYWGSVPAGEAHRILRRAFLRIDRRRGAS